MSTPAPTRPAHPPPAAPMSAHSDAEAAPGPARRPAGTGSLRQRRPGVYELRVRSQAPSGASCQRSYTLHGTRLEAETELDHLLALVSEYRSVATPGSITVAQVLGLWLSADQPWKPSTLVGYRSVAAFLVRDPLGRHRACRVHPAAVRQSLDAWQRQGAGQAVTGARFRVLRSALSWAYNERLLEVQPIRYMRGPARVPPRRPLSDQELAQLLRTAEALLLEAVANRAHPSALHRSGLDLLLVRLAADTGARRGELACLRRDDLAGRVLHITRAESAGHLTLPKSGHGRVLTLGSSTARLWHTLEVQWDAQAHAHDAALGPWLFSADLLHHRRLSAGALGHRFAALRDRAGVSHATLHRLRHQVATFLVARGEILEAQARLGHADAATTLREYAYALPLTDRDAADAIDRYLDDATAPRHRDPNGRPPR